jgi:hypothetical protein
MTPTNFEDFRQKWLGAGFNQVLEREWAPLAVLDTHTHPFAVRAQVTRGELWLTIQGKTRHLQAGATFELDRDVPHEERYGPEGASYWVARKD